MMDNPQLREHEFTILVEVLSKVESKSELRSVLNTILTASEKYAIAQRLTIFCRVRAGKKYYEIEGALGVSPATVSKALDLYLKNGDDNKNFNKVISRYKEPEFKYQVKSKHPQRKASKQIFGIRALLREDEIDRRKYK